MRSGFAGRCTTPSRRPVRGFILCVKAASRMISRCRARPPAPLSPGGVRIFILWRSFAATGRGWRHPTFTGRRPAPGRRARWLEIQGGRCVRYRRGPAMAPSRSGAQAPTLSAQISKEVFPGQGGFKDRSGDRKIAERGCRKATRWGRETAPEDRKILLGCGVGARAPVAPSPAPPAGLVALEEERIASRE